MGTLKVKELLENTFGNTFEFHPKFFDEFEELIKGTGSERKILKEFLNRLHMIIELDGIDYGLKWLEHLKSYDNLYSLHLNADSKNYRLLFSKNKKGKIFLCAFYERSGKKNSSYEKYAKIALSRREGDWYGGNGYV